ncbi:hypothetical protein, partial [Candidatus Phytoplasma pyri]|uniref:hypothetical protein n=1 Tax=Candidatus Phytoplasma pyri TaxID=47566 RepID=UPI003982FAF3
MNNFRKIFLIFSLVVFLLLFYLFFGQKIKTIFFKDDSSNLSSEESISDNVVNNNNESNEFYSQSQKYISKKKREIFNSAFSYFASYIKNYFTNKTDKIKQNNSLVNEKKVISKNENTNNDNNAKK